MRRSILHCVLGGLTAVGAAVGIRISVAEDGTSPVAPQLEIVACVPAAYEAPFSTTAMSGRGRYLATTKNNTSTVWDLTTGARLWEGKGIVVRLADDGRTLLASGPGNGVFKRSEKDWYLALHRDFSRDTRAQFSSDGKYLVYSAQPSSEFRWMVARLGESPGVPPIEYTLLPGSIVVDAAPTKNGETVLALVRHGPPNEQSVVECDLATGRELRRWPVGSAPEWLVPGEFLVVDGGDAFAFGFVNNVARTGLGLVHCFNKHDGTLRCRIDFSEIKGDDRELIIHPHLEFSPDGRYCAVSEFYPEAISVLVFSTQDGKLVNKLPARVGERIIAAPSDSTSQSSFSADGRSFLIYTDKGFVLRWDFQESDPAQSKQF